MAISLQKGGNVNLSKTDPNLKQVLLGLYTVLYRVVL